MARRYFTSIVLSRRHLRRRESQRTCRLKRDRKGGPWYPTAAALSLSLRRDRQGGGRSSSSPHFSYRRSRASGSWVEEGGRGGGGEAPVREEPLGGRGFF